MDEPGITQLIILSRSLEGQIVPSNISKDIGITRQAVSYHLKNLRKSGYVNEENRITQTGVEFLYNGLKSMRDQISKTLSALDNTQIWEAFADSDLKKGDKVFLQMKNGFLHASLTERSGSIAVCTVKSKNKGVTGVSLIQGIIPLKPASVKIIVIADIDESSDTDELIFEVRKRIEGNEAYTCTIGELSHFVIAQIKKECINEFGSMESAFDAAQRGVNSTIIVSRRRFTYESARLENLILVHPGVKINIEEL